ncbi:ABC transporter ATP-binding protein [Polaribacter sp.]|jgi:lipopolysaccharide transport system ATP-binding protein|uniref:ABC transporter ATP-binding protein n=1 Tax=Polaribacter sp. TaxID=1920175 RepID=UPI003EEE3004
MATPIIKIENLSKIYRLGQIGTGTLRDDYKRWIYKIRGKEDPFLKIGEANDRNKKGNSDYIYALKDINLEVMPGEILGIIGKNGAGKSSLLKILSKVTGPTTGSISYNGRIGSLLEVGTGFHPELTGRENIFLNGAILGMTKTEIKSKFDEIVDFSGVERYIDTPVKRYSSGMMVRLGFAVAAHLEPEILVVDEVLAVGDAEFQKKAIGKMQDVSKNEGRTVLFVSHNMASINKLCKKGVVLENGGITYNGEVEDAINYYLSQNNYEDLSSEKFIESRSEKKFQLIYAKASNEKNEVKGSFETKEDIYLLLRFSVKERIPGLYGYLQISKKDSDVTVLVSDSNDLKMNFFDRIPLGETEIKIKIPKRLLAVGEYIIYLNFGSHMNLESFNVDSPGNILSLKISDNDSVRGNRRGGFLSTLLEWEFANN